MKTTHALSLFLFLALVSAFRANADQSAGNYYWSLKRIKSVVADGLRSTEDALNRRGYIYEDAKLEKTLLSGSNGIPGEKVFSYALEARYRNPSLRNPGYTVTVKGTEVQNVQIPIRSGVDISSFELSSN